VAGVVRDSLGVAVRRAEVLIDSASVGVFTNDDGFYRLDSVALGRVSVVARRMGFRPSARSVVTRAGTVTQLDFALMPVAQRLSAVVVAEKSEPYDARLEGFNARKDDKVGYFIERDKLDRGSSHLTEILRTVPGVRMVRTGRGGSFHSIRIRGADCPPMVFLDGFPATSGEFDLDTVDPQTLEGVEVYATMTLVPGVFQSPGQRDRCGVVALWSRPAPGRVARTESRATEAVDLSRLVAAEQVFTAEEVDSAAHLMEGEGVPVYPDSLWRLGVGGSAVVEFVVSASGEVEMATFGIISATHEAFVSAAREAMSRAAFVPAVAGGRRVRQVVQMPFEFRIPTPPTP
jgi:TonB family protein